MTLNNAFLRKQNCLLIWENLIDFYLGFKITVIKKKLKDKQYK